MLGGAMLRNSRNSTHNYLCENERNSGDTYLNKIRMKAATRLTWEWQHNNNIFFWWYANLECKRAIAVATPRGHSFRVYTVGREFCGTKIDRVPFTTAVLTVIEIHHRSWIWRCLDRVCLYHVLRRTCMGRYRIRFGFIFAYWRRPDSETEGIRFHALRSSYAVAKDISDCDAWE